MKNVLTFVTDGDYHAIYMSGKLYMEEDEIRVTDMFDLINSGKVGYCEEMEVDCDWVDEFGGHYPAKLEDLEKFVL